MELTAFTNAEMTPDQLTMDRVLADPNRLAAESSLPLREAEGRPGIPLAPGTEITLDVSADDFGAGDQLVFTAYVPEGQGLGLLLNLETASQTPGVQGADRFFGHQCLGRGQRLQQYGWNQVICPIENLHMYGKPNFWHDVVRLVLRPGIDGDGILLSEIRLQKRAKATGPRLTNEALLTLLDLDRPELAAVKAAAVACDTTQALAELDAHFCSRATPAHIYGATPREPGHDTGTADQICAHFINNQQLPETIDWRANPIGYLEWMHAFNRHNFMGSLSRAYHATGNEKYAAELDSLISSWIQANPVPLGHNGGGDPAWETLSTAVRIYAVWLQIFFGLKDSAEFRPATRLQMLKSIYAHAEHLMQYSVLMRNNWLIVESQVIALIGMLFPEFKRSADWQAEGWCRLAEEMKVQVYSDGAQYELATGYHMMSINGFLAPFRIARLNDYPVPDGFEERLIKAHEYIMKLTRPDFLTPAPNDSGSCKLGLPVSLGQPWLKGGAELFDRTDMLWVATCGKQGTRPECLSVAFDDAGYYVMRSGWDKNDRYLFFDGGPFGKSHQHEDKLGFELYAYGEPFILDPGISSYMEEKWTYYYRLTTAHNTIMVDGKAQCRHNNQTQAEHCRSVAGENTWQSAEGLDFVSAAYRAGYDGVDTDLVHQRSILFVGGLYWILFDEVAGEGEHRIDALFHFRPTRVLTDPERGAIFTSRQASPNLDLLLWPQCRDVELSVVSGRQDPVQGWLSVAGEDVPAPVGIISKTATLPFRQALLMVPYNTGTECGYRMFAGEAGDTWTCDITRPDNTVDSITYDWQSHTCTRSSGN